MNYPLWYWRKYFSDNADMVAVIDAIQDKTSGLGLIWNITDFDAVFERLNEYPSNWVIGQVRDQLHNRINILARK